MQTNQLAAKIVLHSIYRSVMTVEDRENASAQLTSGFTFTQKTLTPLINISQPCRSDMFLYVYMCTMKLCAKELRSHI